MCRSEGVVKLARTQAKEKNNKPHEERRNQEQYKKATPSFSAWRLQLTVIFYHFAGGTRYSEQTHSFMCSLSSQLWDKCQLEEKLKEHFSNTRVL